MVKSLASTLELGNIYYTSLSAKLRRLGEVVNMEVQVKTSYAVHEDKILYRYTTHCTLQGRSSESKPISQQEDKRDSDDEEATRPILAEIEVVLVCEYVRPQDLPTPPATELEMFGEDVAIDAVFPYLREAISSTATRLGLPVLTIGIRREGERIPATVHGRRP